MNAAEDRRTSGMGMPCTVGHFGPRLKKLSLAVVLAVALASATWASGSHEQARESTDDQPLVLAFIPQENPEKLLGDIAAVSTYLSREMGLLVEGFVTQDQAAAVEALRNGDADISFMGALPYVLARNEIGAEVILAEVYRGAPTYRGRIFVRRDSGISSVAELRGKTIAFADPLSESGYLYPLDILVQQGLIERGADPTSFFSTVYFAGGYQQAIQAVAAGFVDAAGASQFAELLLTPEQFAEVTWIAESEEIPSHAVIVRSGLAPERVDRFRQAMLSLNEPEHLHLLAHLYGPDGYVAVDHASYEGVERLARLYGLLP